jgi:hypothetical protein
MHPRVLSSLIHVQREGLCARDHALCLRYTRGYRSDVTNRRWQCGPLGHADPLGVCPRDVRFALFDPPGCPVCQ